MLFLNWELVKLTDLVLNPKYLNFYFLVLLLLLINCRMVIGQVLNYETRITINSKSEKLIEKLILVQINSPEESWMSHIELKYNSHQDFSFRRAHLFDKNGVVVRMIKKKDIVVRSDISHGVFYQDDLLAEFDLYHDTYPYQIEYEYSFKEKEFFNIASWSPLVFQNVPTVKGLLEIDTPPWYELRNYHRGKINYDKSLTEEKFTYTWTASYDGVFSDEVFAPSLFEKLPIVQVMPINFKYGVNGNSSTWQSFGSWLFSLNMGTEELPESEVERVKRLVYGVEDRIDKVRRIYHYLQDNTQYVNVSIGTGGLKSYPAEYVAQHMYGDCKALTNYMRAMLKCLDIDSYYTVINAGNSSRQIEKEFPSQQFNHVILAIPNGEDTIWLENTSSSLPFNYLGLFTQDRLALVVNGMGSELVRTPKFKMKDVLVERNYFYQLDNDKYWNKNVSVILRGQNFEKFRQSLDNKDETEFKEKMVSILNESSFELKDWTMKAFHRDSVFVKLHLKGIGESPIRKIGKFKVVSPFKISIPNFERPEERMSNLKISIPINLSDTVSMKFESKNKLELPDTIDLYSKYGEYCSSCNRNKDIIECRERLIIRRNFIPIEEYPMFYAFIKSAKSHQKKALIILE